MERNSNMDGGSLRGQRPSDTRQSVRQEQPVQRPVSAPAPSEPRLTTHQPKQSKPKQPSKRFLLPAVLVVGVVIMIAGYLFFSNNHDVTSGVDKSRYQAVFLSNGQVYFGKLESSGSDSVKLKDVYYVQGQQAAGTENLKNTEANATDSNNLELVKLDKAVYSPENEMVMLKSQVLFYQNLKADSKIVQLISEYKG